MARCPVEAVTASAYTVPTDAPEGDGTLTWSSTTLVLVEVRAGGRTGIGWTYGPAACAALVDEKLAGVVTGSEVDPRRSFHAMVAAVRNVGRPGVASMAISAVDVALWDLWARLLDLPLARLLGAVREEVPAYGSGGFTTYDDDRLVRQLEGWLDQGMTRVKIKIGESWGSAVQRDLERTRLTRDVVGPDVEVFVDANGGYQVKQAQRVGRRLDELDVRWFEEPVSSDDLVGLRQVREAVACDVAAGEYGYDLAYFARMSGAQAVDCLQADATRCGGYTEWLRVAAVAAAAQLEISGHCAPALHVPVAAAVPNLRHLEWFHDHARIEQLLLEGAPVPSGGTARAGDGPGHGMRFRHDAAREYRIR